MKDKVAETPPPEQAAPARREAGVVEALEGLADAALQEVVDRGRAILKEREQERRREALREIQRIAREHGLEVVAGEKKRKRGRPAKEEGEG